MRIDTVKSHPLFPFSRYFDSTNHYIEAQKYWLALLRDCPRFVADDWQPHAAMPDLPEAMYEGVVASIVNVETGKAIRLGTTSVEGMAHMLERENGPMDPTALRSLQEAAPDLPLDPRLRDGLSHAEAVREAKALHARAPVTCEVDDTVILGASGRPTPLERLVLVGHIDPRAEPLALRAFDLFLQDGPAKSRVHDAFPDPLADIP